MTVLGRCSGGSGHRGGTLLAVEWTSSRCSLYHVEARVTNAWFASGGEGASKWNSLSEAAASVHSSRGTQDIARTPTDRDFCGCHTAGTARSQLQWSSEESKNTIHLRYATQRVLRLEILAFVPGGSVCSTGD